MTDVQTKNYISYGSFYHGLTNVIHKKKLTTKKNRAGVLLQHGLISGLKSLSH